MRNVILLFSALSLSSPAIAQPGSPEAVDDVLTIATKLHVAEGWAKGLEQGLAGLKTLPVPEEKRGEFIAAAKAEFAAEAPGYMQMLVAREAAALSDEQRQNLLVFVDLPSIQYQARAAAGMAVEGAAPKIENAEADTLHRIDGDYIGQFIADMTSAQTLQPLTDRILTTVVLQMSK
ncbi:MAG: hypothetical protein KGO53_15410 [Alphaproteobacteria bacterium]|nr:hypothetical protein [Alphaproteobacteria bacterium]